MNDRMNFRAVAATVVLAASLSGCALGITPESGSPSSNFTANVEYQQAWRMADAQAKQCLPGDSAYAVRGGVDSVGRTAQTLVEAPFTRNDIVRVEIKALDASRSEVRIAMWGEGIWNQVAVDAMHDAIVYGVTGCTSYMPHEPVKKPR